MRINSLLKHLNLQVENNHDVSNVTGNSKDCIYNSVFISTTNNTKYIKEAINNGAKTVIINDIYDSDAANIIYYHNPKDALARLLYEYNKYLFNSLYLIGVIGTNGKTTTSTLIYDYIRFNNIDSMLIGSNGCYYNDNHIKHNNTTPDISILYKYFNIAYKNNIKYIVMELSSIGVSELRIRYIPFNILVFTNFSEDHLDYHINMDRYLFNKCIPFYQLDNNSYSIVNIDDSNYEEIIKHSYSNVITYSIINDSDYKATDLNILNSGITFKINNIEYKSNLLGRFNIYNLLPLFPISKILNLTNLKLFMNDLKIQGRMNLIKIDNKNIIIDYAHTPEAVKSVIQEVLSIASGRIFVIVGCGGNREREKRRIIGNILKSYNIIPIITTDNPRYEDPLDIINDINIDNSFTVVADRKKAIIYGINNMKDNDYLLILGKGCEDYMEIKGRKIPYSDYMVIEEYINGN